MAESGTPWRVAEFLFMELTESTENVTKRISVASFGHCFTVQVLQIIRCDRLRDCQQCATVAPESAYIVETNRDSFLMLFVQVFNEIAGSVHVPRNEVIFVFVKIKMLLAVWFGDTVPGLCKDVTKSRRFMMETQPDMEMRDAP